MTSKLYTNILRPLSSFFELLLLLIGICFFITCIGQIACLLVGIAIYLAGLYVRVKITKSWNGFNHDELVKFLIGFTLLGYFLYFTNLDPGASVMLKDSIIYNIRFVFVLLLYFIYQAVPINLRIFRTLILVGGIFWVYTYNFKPVEDFIRDLINNNPVLINLLFIVSIPFLFAYLSGYLSSFVGQIRRTMFLEKTE